MVFGQICVERSVTKKMGNHGTNITAVPTGYTRAPVPASESPSSNDPPSYSVCVPYPPTINSNHPDGHSSLLANSPEVYPPSENSICRIQTANLLLEGRPCAPFLDVPSKSENPPGVHEPRVTLNNVQRAYKPSCTAPQGSPPPYSHEKKTKFLPTISGNSSKNKWVGLRTVIVVGITISTIIFASRTRRIHYHDIPDVYDEKKINFDDKYRYRIFNIGNGTIMVDFDVTRLNAEKQLLGINFDDKYRSGIFGIRNGTIMVNFDMLRFDAEKQLLEIGAMEVGEANKAYLRNVDVESSRGDKVNKTKIKEYALKDRRDEYRETDININLDDHTDYISKKSRKEDDDDSTASNFELKYPNFPDVSNARSSTFEDQKNDNPSRNANINRIAKRFADILGIPRIAKTNENDVQKPASNDDS